MRQTFAERDVDEADGWKNLKKMSFLEFLQQVGMFSELKPVSAYSEHEIKEAKTRYINAISASVKGTGKIIHKRKVKDIFTNGYNKKIMQLHQANHDIQIVIDQFACAQYADISLKMRVEYQNCCEQLMMNVMAMLGRWTSLTNWHQYWINTERCLFRKLCIGC